MWIEMKQLIFFELAHLDLLCLEIIVIFSSPGQSPGRAIVLPPASELAAASAKSLTLQFFM